jgi:Co/Zn/Cd efflux system component
MAKTPKPNPLEKQRLDADAATPKKKAAGASRPQQRHKSPDAPGSPPWTTPGEAADPRRKTSEEWALTGDAVPKLADSARERPHRVRPFDYLQQVATVVADGQPKDERRPWHGPDYGHGPCCSKNVQILAVAAVLFGAITSAQFFAAAIANSNALLVDAVCMAVDTATFLGNILAECTGHRSADGASEPTWAELIGAGFSLWVLVGISAYFLAESALGIITQDDDGEEVDPFIVFGFAVGGLVFDAMSLAAFLSWGGKGILGLGGGDGEQQQGQQGEKLNMGSALMHVLADSLRSITTLVESLLIFYFPEVSSALFDSWATLVVAGLVIVAAGPPLVSWARSSLALCRGRHAAAYEPLPDREASGLTRRPV